MYRLFMRWVYKKLYPLISPHLRPRQFGGKRGVSTAHATQAFLNDMVDGTPLGAINAFDVYHAFESPPRVVISTVLAKMGTPTKLLRLIQTVLEFGATYIRGSPTEVCRTTHGVEQGCTLSCFLFVVVFEIPLRFLQLHGIRLSVFGDDISSPNAPSNGLHTASLVQQGLALIGCQLNVTKSESLGLTPLPVTSPSLPKYSPPPSPTQAGDDFWSPISSPSTPEWAVLTEHQLLKVPYLMRLGHPLPARFNQQQGFRVIADELRAQLANLNAHPIQTLDRVTLVNTVVLPRLLYRCESFPLTPPQKKRTVPGDGTLRIRCLRAPLPSCAEDTIHSEVHRSWDAIFPRAVPHQGVRQPPQKSPARLHAHHRPPPPGPHGLSSSMPCHYLAQFVPRQ